MASKVAIIIYSVYGHIAQMAEAEKAGIEKAGGSATIYQIPETLSDEDTTGTLWPKAALAGKYVGQFVSTGTPGGGQDVTVMNALSTYAFHGMIFVPLGYSTSFAQLTNLTEVHGGSPWGAEEVASIQGETFYKVIVKAFD
ncbi:flavoprotein-like protein [Lipomyces starkeyi]